jgi:hypothetical protein
MVKQVKPIFMALVAALALAAAAGPGSARSFSLSNRNIRIVWTALEFAMEGAPNVIKCPVTLEGSFHSSTISKVIGALIGYISRASTASASCTGGNATLLAETLPWHIRYRGFQGRLPTIEFMFVSIVGFAILLRWSVDACLFRSTAAAPFVGGFHTNIENGQVIDFTAEPLQGIPLERTLIGLCGPVTSPKLNGTVTLLGNTTRISITLI